MKRKIIAMLVIVWAVYDLQLSIHTMSLPAQFVAEAQGRKILLIVSAVLLLVGMWMLIRGTRLRWYAWVYFLLRLVEGADMLGILVARDLHFHNIRFIFIYAEALFFGCMLFLIPKYGGEK